MSARRPPPSEELNPAAEVEPRQAASAIVLRDAPGGPEVVMVERNPRASFMGGAWVFPGGAVHDADAGHADAARRELREEADIGLEGSELVPFSRWITPAEVEVRFDTWFFVARAPDGAEPRPDGEECVAAGWLAPGAALERHGRGELQLVFPTIKHLEQLAEFGSVDEVLEAARGREVVPVLPRVVAGDDGPHVVLPGEPGYES